MPVSEALAESNQTQRERLRALVRRLDAGRLAVRLPNGWTVAGTLAHMALWDRQRLLVDAFRVLDLRLEVVDGLPGVALSRQQDRHPQRDHEGVL